MFSCAILVHKLCSSSLQLLHVVSRLNNFYANFVLQLWSGFTGSHTFNFYYAGLCLAINTFGAFVLYTLILYAGALYLAIATTSSSASKGKISNRTVCAVALVVHTIVYVSITHQYTIVCVSCIGAAILRRHLMVWAVFAPKVRQHCLCFSRR